MTSIPGYRLLREVASGSSGRVFEAIQESLDRRVAVKVLAPGLFGAAETRARFLRESRLQAKLSHPNLLALIDSGFAESQAYLVTEFVTSGTLRDRLDQSGPLSLETALRLGAEIASGLAHAHEAGIVHRDLKPENVLLAADGSAKVADFGLAKRPSSDGSPLTATGMILGTPGYMAPEVFQGEPASAGADLYALGVVLFEMLAGCRPFEGDDPGLVFREQLQDDPPRLRDRRPDIPAALEALIGRCLCREAIGRPGSAAEIAAALEAMSRLDGPGMAKHASTPTIVGRAISRTRTKPAVTHVRGAPPTSGRPLAVRESGWGRKAAPLAAICALLLAASAGWILRERAGERGAGTVAASTNDPELRPTSPPGSTQPSGSGAPEPPTASAALPEVSGLAVGTDCVRLYLSAAPPVGTRFVYRREGETREDHVPLAGGQSEELVKGFLPGSRYSGALVLGDRRASIAFETLGNLGASGAMQLATGDCGQIVLCSLGSRVAVAWHERGEGVLRVKLRASPDAGRTWHEAIQLGGDLSTDPTLAWTDVGLVAAWGEEGREGSQIAVMATGDSVGSPPLRTSLSRVWFSPAGGASLDIVARGVGAVGVGGVYARLDLETRPLAEEARGVPTSASGLGGAIARLQSESGAISSLPPTGERRVFSFLVRSDERLLAFAGPGPGENAIWFTSSGLDGRSWKPFAPLTPATRYATRNRFDAAAAHGLVGAVYESSKCILVQVSRDGGETFSPPRDIAPPFEANGMPAIAAWENRLLICFFSWLGSRPEGRLHLAVSEDGSTWKPAGSATVPLEWLSGTRSCLSVAGDRAVIVFEAANARGVAGLSLPLPTAR